TRDDPVAARESCRAGLQSGPAAGSRSCAPTPGRSGTGDAETPGVAPMGRLHARCVAATPWVDPTLLTGREELLDLVERRLASVLAEHERLGVLDLPSALLAVQLDQVVAILVGHRCRALLRELQQVRRPLGVAVRDIRPRPRLPRVPVAELRRHRGDALPLLVRDAVD